MLSPYHFSHQLRVRYSEIDGQKIVFNAHYMTYLDIAITEYFREVLKANWIELAEKHIFDVALVKTTLEFKKPAKLDDILHIYCRISKLGNSSLTANFAITREENEILLEAETIYVNYNVATGKSQPIPQDIREKIIQFEQGNVVQN